MINDVIHHTVPITDILYPMEQWKMSDGLLGLECQVGLNLNHLPSTAQQGFHLFVTSVV